jgi:hypothetical protein
MTNSIYQFKDNTFFVTPKDDWKDRIEVELGDSKQPDKVYPQVKIMRWDNEVNFSARLKDFDNYEVTSDQEKIKLVNGKKEIHLYEIVPNEEHPEGGFEFEIILKEKPLTNKIEFSLNTKGLDFFYQPELTEEENKTDIRPENVIGSYAVYASETKTNYVDSKEYKCGKVGHIFRPGFNDAEGKHTWADLNIDKEKELITITIPQKFIDNAIYPVTGDDLTFGYTSNGASAHDSSYLKGSLFTGAAGTGVSISGYWQKWGTPNRTVKYALYTHSDLSLLTNGTTDSISVTDNDLAWRTANFTSAPTVTAVGYVLCGWNDTSGPSGSIYFRHDTGDADQEHFQAQVWNGWPASLSPTHSTRKFSIYCTYTAGGSASLSASATPSATPSASVSATPSISVSVSISKSPSVSASVSVSATPSISASVSVSATPSISASASVSATPSISASISVSLTPSVSISLSPSVSASVSVSLTPSVSASVSVSATPSISVSATPSISVSASPSVSISFSPSVSISATPSISVSKSPSISASVSVSATPSVSASVSVSLTPSVSASASISATPSVSVSLTPSVSASVSASLSLSLSPSISASLSISLSPSFSPSPSQAPLDSNTKLLLHCNGADASTSFLDSSGQDHIMTANGTAQIDTAQKKFGSASGLFDGNSDYLTVDDSDDWYFGSNNFTIDCWVRFNALPGEGLVAMLFCQKVDDSNLVFFGLYNNGAAKFWYFGARSTADGEYISVIKTATVVVDTWYHIALVRSGNDFKIFQDGVQVGTTVTDADPVLNYASALAIGAQPAGDTHFLNGWIDEYRISNGVARWTTNFTPEMAEYEGSSPSISISASPSISASLSVSLSVSLTPSVSVSKSPSISVSASPSLSASLTPSVSASLTPSVSASLTPSVSVSASPSISVSKSPSASASISVSLTPSVSASATGSATPSISASVSESLSPSLSVSLSISASPSISVSLSISLSPSISASVSVSLSPSISLSKSESASPSVSESASPSLSISLSPSASVSLSPSPSPSPPIYEDKYEVKGTIYVSKYSVRGNVYADKYPKTNNTYVNKYRSW